MITLEPKDLNDNLSFNPKFDIFIAPSICWAAVCAVSSLTAWVPLEQCGDNDDNPNLTLGIKLP